MFISKTIKLCTTFVLRGIPIYTFHYSRYLMLKYKWHTFSCSGTVSRSSIITANLKDISVSPLRINFPHKFHQKSHWVPLFSVLCTMHMTELPRNFGSYTLQLMNKVFTFITLISSVHVAFAKGTLLNFGCVVDFTVTILALNWFIFKFMGSNFFWYFHFIEQFFLVSKTVSIIKLIIKIWKRNVIKNQNSLNV